MREGVEASEDAGCVCYFYCGAVVDCELDIFRKDARVQIIS